MDDETFKILYQECRNQGYTHSEAVTRCKDFEVRYLSQRRDPYDFADMTDSLPRGGRGDEFGVNDHEHHHAAYQTTERRPTQDNFVRGYRATFEYKYTDRVYQDNESTYRPKNKYYDEEPQAPKPPRRQYYTEERRPHRETSYEVHESNVFQSDETRPKRTHGAHDYNTYTATPPPRPTRTHTNSTRYNTTERAPRVPRDTPKDNSYYYPSGRPSPPPRPHPTSYSYSSRAPPSQPPQGTKPQTDLYTTLGIPRSATADEIKKAHRKLCMKWHPDRCTEAKKDVATQMMAEINQANDVLGDEKLRALYDATGCLPGVLD
ncbi:hypothetical protein LEMA_P042930.1 [Plenodomus lingam JN3]|uniref:J domain-containing protein n=1 Tax=Leptosphaeria maculans (strain JN3 / isolate v23.1.3 / race Av1-4-5-6-7-8) TaxID=985895 RepID=E4ZP23_LEPMJ|nr:hypothetical protein LEMA_P042930.1 [Plenodomus lingam JN3]CBX93392.1 hypothetical protein LEMA_P042930.1 [Plenodomus lingam JN3]